MSKHKHNRGQHGQSFNVPAGRPRGPNGAQAARMPNTPSTQRMADVERNVMERITEVKDSVQKELSSEIETARAWIMKAGAATLKTIKANPFPIALVGLGIACVGFGTTWLLMGEASKAAKGTASGGRIDAPAKAAKPARDAAQRNGEGNDRAPAPESRTIDAEPAQA